MPRRSSRSRPASLTSLREPTGSASRAIAMGRKPNDPYGRIVPFREETHAALAAVEQALALARAGVGEVRTKAPRDIVTAADVVGDPSTGELHAAELGGGSWARRGGEWQRLAVSDASATLVIEDSHADP